MKYRGIACAIGAGILLYIPFTIVGYIPYMSLPFREKTILLIASVLVGGAISVAAIAYRSRLWRRTFLRTVILFAALLLTVAINGCIGTIRLLNTKLQILDSDAMGRASGLGMVFFLGGLLLISVVTNVAVAICRAIEQKKREGKDGG